MFYVWYGFAYIMLIFENIIEAYSNACYFMLLLNTINYYDRGVTLHFLCKFEKKLSIFLTQ
jgi:hypothetical protein